MDGRAWYAAVHGITKSWTRLSDFTFIFHFHALEKEMATHSSILAWRIPGTGDPGGLLSMGSHRVRHDWSDLVVAVAKFVVHFYLSLDKQWWQQPSLRAQDPFVNRSHQQNFREGKEGAYEDAETKGINCMCAYPGSHKALTKVSSWLITTIDINSLISLLIKIFIGRLYISSV